jgi:type III pantothenate kinase
MANPRTLIAVDIGNSRIKLGQFRDAVAIMDGPRDGVAALPEPTNAFDLPICVHAGEFDVARLHAWCDAHVAESAEWRLASVHREATGRLTAAVLDWAARNEPKCWVRQLTSNDVPMVIQVDEPTRVGIDRLLAAVAANRLRSPGRAAIVVDLGSAITVDLLTSDGTFAGGAILPGIAMSTRALAEQTDALPHVPVEQLEKPPVALGKSTKAAIESGVYWGAVGAIRELIVQLSRGLADPPEILVTGGASRQVAELLNAERSVRHVPHLVLSGIALVHEASQPTIR